MGYTSIFSPALFSLFLSRLLLFHFHSQAAQLKKERLNSLLPSLSLSILYSSNQKATTLFAFYAETTALSSFPFTASFSFLCHLGNSTHYISQKLSIKLHIKHVWMKCGSIINQENLFHLLQNKRLQNNKYTSLTNSWTTNESPRMKQVECFTSFPSVVCQKRLPKRQSISFFFHSPPGLTNPFSLSLCPFYRTKGLATSHGCYNLWRFMIIAN